MSLRKYFIDDSAQTYRRLLYLYPSEFRRRFGEPMADMFREQAEARVAQRGLVGLALAWGVVLRELPSTVVLQHWAVLERRNPGVSWFRLTLAGLLPLAGAVAWRCGQFEPPPAAGVALWLASCVLPALFYWGRGWSSVFASVRGSATATSLLILWTSLADGPGMPVATALVLVACAATAGLAVGAVVRAIVEGLELRLAPSPLWGRGPG